MNSVILLFFCVLNTVYGIYKIPEHDACVLRVLLCDDFIKPLTPADNSTLEMFETIGQLNAVCDELSKFRICLKNAEIFCTEHSDLDVGFELLKNRKLAFDLCVRGSAHQHVYMMVEGCVNKYSHSAVEFCTDKAVETVGLDFSLGDYESECRFLGEIQHCHIAVVSDQCGNIAGNLLEKLVVFRGERDFMCIGYENEKLKNLEEFDATMDSYVQQYRNRDYEIEKEDEAERIDGLKKFKTLHEDFQDQTSSKFQPRVPPVSVEDCASVKECDSHNERPLSPKISGSTKKPSPCSCLSHQEILHSNMPQYAAEDSKRFYEQQNDRVLSNENYACEMKASFLLTGILSNSEDCHLVFGEADILWDAYSPLKDVFCAWMVNEAAPTHLFNCSILIDDSVLVREVCKRKMECDLPFKAILAVSLDKVINFFKKHEHDIRYSCSEQLEEQIHSTSRKGLVPSDINMHGTINESFGQKYNFYDPEYPEYPIDTEIHLLSGNNLESEMEIEDKFPPQNDEGNLNPFLNDEIFSEKNLKEPFTLYPSASSELSSQSYRPYELFRPRLGETSENGDQDLGIKDVPESDTIPDMLSFEDYMQNGYLDTEEICPALPENVSKLTNKLDKKKYMYISKREDVSLRKAGESEDTNTDDQQNEEIYTVTTSSEIETTSGPDDMIVYEYETAQSLEEDPHISNTRHDFAEVPQRNDMKSLKFGKDSAMKSTKARSSRIDFIKLISDYQNNKYSFPDKFAEASTNRKAIPEEKEFSPKSKNFSKRSDKKDSIKMREKFINTFEILAKIKMDLRRILQMLNETGMKNSKGTSPGKYEL
ncbi:hypothetical protein HNY73_003240 [Argiope bruennichi]|uniref:Uncharacterized protein n=1 Tax=Argiope bruennichi TaxID=94029 RepID=A0A8T0FW90_ARGBR|nr:hypothetical protein HNY73_003240 [Argiope bruennichi]